MRKFLCIQHLYCEERDLWAPIQKGDIVTWSGERINHNDRGLFYEFVETGNDQWYHSVGFVELPDLSDEALEKENQNQVYEEDYSFTPASCATQ